MNMATRKAVAVATSLGSTDSILSFKDGAFKQAGAAETLEDFALYMIDNVAGFGTPDFKIEPKIKEELVEGYRLRFSGMKKHLPITYAVIGGNYIPLDTLEADQKSQVKEKIEVGVILACSYTTHEFGKLKNDRPAYHAVISEWREKTGVFCSNRWNDLVKEAKRLQSGGAKGKRKANLDFAETVAKTVEDLKVKLTKCISVKDATADQVKFNKALAAFLAVWKA
jgi:hypothetical protein